MALLPSLWSACLLCNQPSKQLVVVVGTHLKVVEKHMCYSFPTPSTGVVQGPRGVESQEEELTSEFPS